MSKKTLGKYTKIPHLRRFVLQNFPFIEEDFDALTDYELLCKVVEFLNKTIDSQNLLTENMTELENLFNQLHDYVEHYFDSLDVQDEINNKLNEMAQDGSLQTILQTILVEPLQNFQNEIDRFENNIEGQVTSLENQIVNSIGSTPIAVTNMSQMTDHNKIYVLTTNGNWYYWNNNAWTSGGTYQSTGIADNEVTRSNLNFTVKSSKQLYNADNPTVVHLVVSQMKFVESANSYSVVVPVSPNTQYFIKKANLGSKFLIYESENAPAVNVTVSVIHGDNTTSFEHFITGENTNYLTIFIYNSTADPDVTFEQISQTLMVNSGDLPVAWQPYKSLKLVNDDYSYEKIRLNKIEDSITTYQLFDKKDYYFLPIYTNSDKTTIVDRPNNRTFVIPIEGGETYTVKRKTALTSLFMVATTAIYPDNAVSVIDSAGSYGATTETSLTIETSSEANYLLVFALNTSASPNVTVQEVADELLIYKGTEEKSFVNKYILPIEDVDFAPDSIDYNVITQNKGDLCDLSFIKSITACGDSYTNCGVWQNGAWHGGSTEFSWIGMLGRKNGIDISKCGVGGVTTITYQTTNGCLNKVLSEAPSALYYLALGINDCNQHGVNFIGSDEDINDSDYTQNANTFWGNYGKIIQQIKNHAPKAKFIMITIMRPDSMNPNYSLYSEAIKGIANYYGFPYIEPIKNKAFKENVLTALYNQHPNYAGWNALSRIIESETSKVINNNMDYFNNINL